MILHFGDDAAAKRVFARLRRTYEIHLQTILLYQNPENDVVNRMQTSLT